MKSLWFGFLISTPFVRVQTRCSALKISVHSSFFLNSFSWCFLMYVSCLEDCLGLLITPSPRLLILTSMLWTCYTTFTVAACHDHGPLASNPRKCAVLCSFREPKHVCLKQIESRIILQRCWTFPNYVSNMKAVWYLHVYIHRLHIPICSLYLTAYLCCGCVELECCQQWIAWILH